MSQIITFATSLIVFIILAQTTTLSINKRVAAVCLIVFFAASFIPGNYLPAAINSGLYIVLSVFVPVIAFLISARNIQLKLLIYSSLLYVGLIVSLSSLLYWVTNVFLRTVIDYIYTDMVTISILLIVSIITSKSGSVGKVFRIIASIRATQKVMLLVSVWTSALLTSLLLTLLEFIELPGFELAGTLAAVIIILMGIAFPMLIVNSLSNEYHKNIADVMDKQVRAQAAHYETMSAMNEDIKRFRHDYSNLRSGMISFLRRGDVSGALTYLEGDEMSPKELSAGYETGNVILDALLSEKQIAASEVNALIEFSGLVPGDLLKAADICVIFGNALDNAIEACSKVSGADKKIMVRSDLSEGFLFIKIKNPAASSVKILGNTVATTKENKGSHGFGLQSIRTAIGKYSGDMALSCETGIFCVEIDLYLHQ